MVKWNNSTERRHNSLQKNTDVQSANFTLLARVEYKHHHEIDMSKQISLWLLLTHLLPLDPLLLLLPRPLPDSNKTKQNKSNQIKLIKRKNNVVKRARVFIEHRRNNELRWSF